MRSTSGATRPHVQGQSARGANQPCSLFQYESDSDACAMHLTGRTGALPGILQGVFNNHHLVQGRHQRPMADCRGFHRHAWSHKASGCQHVLLIAVQQCDHNRFHAQHRGCQLKQGVCTKHMPSALCTSHFLTLHCPVLQLSVWR